jgi:TrpR-related protein YerC/YecD
MARQFSDNNLKYLFQGILMLHNQEECLNFFEDLCTESELQEMARRLQAAKMLKNNYIYSEIAEQTGLSTATISRVNRCLKYGNDGYITILERLEKAEHR